MIKERIDERTGTILFEEDEDSKKLRRLEKRVKELEERIIKLEFKLEKDS